ncbi:MAG: DNA-binding response regulator [Lentisphaerae bacterium RIFOXYB12_FULL_65_16]|nr:MAG: DNA-binding response regulator [Lentisphaerae bacterium RIFOXYB12_FULL_65_16]OGV95402.1 MAG: DNA-binding response regulator [Lentisphaerae bacterium RIFOXYB12_FULL_65_16]
MRVLVVEDDDKVARFIVRGLREESYAVDHAGNGDEAIRQARVNEYDAIILDVMIPGCNGFEVAATLRQAKVQTPILMLTVKDRTEDKVRGLDAGADDYLTKPFAFAELLARLRALLRRQVMGVEPVLAAADLTLDPSTRTVTRAGHKIELTPKEYGLLDFLLRNKGRVVTRTAIIEHVWDMHFDSDTNLVEVYIRYLRRKIDEEFEPKLIHTVRGVGYQLKDEP